MLKRRSRTYHLSRFCLWFGLLIVPVISATLYNQYQLLYHPYDLNDLKSDEVLMFEHRTGRQRYALKLQTLQKRSRPDIILTGNHVMQNYVGAKYNKKLDIFNFVSASPDVLHELHLLKAFKKIDKLPKKLLVYTMVAHGTYKHFLNERIGESVPPFKDANVTPPFSWEYKNLVWEGAWIFNHKTVQDGFFSFLRRHVVINYSACEKKFIEAKGNQKSIWLKIKLKIAEYITGQAALNIGLLSLHEFCEDPLQFDRLDTSGFVKNSGIVVKHRTMPAGYPTHQTYKFKIKSPEELKRDAERVVVHLQKIEQFASENGFRVVYLFPPRYEYPLNGLIDELPNFIFENNPEFTVVDFRQYSSVKKYYTDATHITDELGDILIPCLEKIIAAKGPLPSHPAINGRGRSVCGESYSGSLTRPAMPSEKSGDQK